MNELKKDMDDMIIRLRYFGNLSPNDKNSKKSFYSIVDELDHLFYDFRVIIAQIGGVRKRDERLKKLMIHTLDGNFTKDNFIEIFFTLRDLLKRLNELYLLVDEQI